MQKRSELTIVKLHHVLSKITYLWRHCVNPLQLLPDMIIINLDDFAQRRMTFQLTKGYMPPVVHNTIPVLNKG